MSDVRPRAAVLSVGSELLLGDLTDTNATWMSLRLKQRGVAVLHHLAVGDDLDAIVGSLRWLGGRVDLIVIGGGLGPTSDDLTREAVAAAAGVEEAIVQRFAALGRPMAPRNRRQARVPAGATAFPPAGTAPAFATRLRVPAADGTGERDVRVVALPGVPWEAQELWDASVGGELDALGATGVTVTRTVRVVGRGESDVASVVEPLLADVVADGALVLAFLARRRAVHVRLTATGADADDARMRTQPAVDAVVAALGAAVVGVDEEDLEALLLQRLAERGETLATAESATAGAIAARLAEIPGASRVLVGGLVVYADAAKARLAGLDPALVAREGAVSAPVAAALARAARERAGADWGVAVTGVAGPGALMAPDGTELPAGTCHWAVCGPDGVVHAEERRLTGDRAAVRERLGSAALDLLRRVLAGDVTG